MLNLNHVRSFIAVIDCGNFKDASRKLICSQPTVSQHILKLEMALQATLVVRDRQRCYPTPEGKLFIPFADSLLSLTARAQNALKQRALTVGASSNIGIYLLQPHMRWFRNKFGQDAQIDIWIGTNPEVAEKLVNNELDVAVMEWWDNRPGFTATLWRRESLVVIVPPSHPWAAQSSVEMDRLLETPLIGGESGSGTGRVLGEAFGDDAERLRVDLQLGSTEAVKHAVKAGLGVSIVLANSVVDEVRAGSLCALSVEGAELKKDIYIMRHANQPSTTLVPRFVDQLVGSQVE